MQNLWSQLTDETTFENAWQKVRSNLGAPGIDRISVQEFGQNVGTNLPMLRNLVKENAYEPLPLKTFEKKQKSGKIRELHILTVRDRIVHEALLSVLQPVFEPKFLNCSYAYRTGRSQQKAIERVERNIKRGRDHFFDGDIKSFFDEIDRKIMLEMLGSQIDDRNVLALLEKCIHVKDGPNGRGIAQGMAIAPLLSNIYLHSFDDKMMRAQWVYIRFSDNLLVLDKDSKKITTASELIAEQLEFLRLKLNKEKTTSGHISKGFVFLGYHFDENGKRPSDTAVERLGEKVGDTLTNLAGLSEKQLHEKLDSIVRGWLNYFHLAETDKRKLFEEIEQKFEPQTDSMPQRILKSALSFQLGDRLQARDTLHSSPVVVSEDAEMNYQWGLMCALTGMRNEAFDSFIAAYRNNPEHADTAYQLGLHYQREQNYEQAIRYLQKAVQINPDGAHLHFALGTALQKMALHGAARKAFAKASNLNPQLKKRLPADLQTQKAKPAQAIEFPRAAVERMLNLFNGREGVFARQWLNESGKIGYMPVYQPLSESEIQQHLQGKQTLGYYIMRTDNMVYQMVIDIDLSRQVREEIASPTGQYQEWKSLLWTDACSIRSALASLEVPAYIEDSGHKGLHVWLFFNEPQPAKKVIIFAKKILEQAGDAPSGINREIFPKQPRVATQALGAMVKLPLGIHKLTNRRCLFLDEQGEAATDQAGFLLSCQTVSSNTFESALERLKKPEAPQKTLVPEEQEKIDKVYAGCNVLRHFKEKAINQRWLNHIERLTVLSILGSLGDTGAQEIHRIIENTSNYSYRITQKFIERKKGFPVSCPKIRQWHSDITPVVGCCCQFPEKKNSYPTPLLHMDPEFIVKLRSKNKNSNDKQSAPIQKSPTPQPQRIPQPAAAAIATVSPAPALASVKGITNLNQFVQDLLELKKQHRSLNQKLTEMEHQLNQHSAKMNISAFETDFGTIRQVSSDGKLKWIIEM